MTALSIRTWSRLAVLIGLVGAALWLPPVILRYAMPALSPFMGLCALLAGHTIGVAVCSVPMLVFLMIRRRAFCHYLCPMGLLVEVCAKARPSARRTYGRMIALGPWLALLSLGGAALAVPYFLLLDPLAIFLGAIEAVPDAARLSQVACAALFGIVIALSLLFPLLWCQKLCPLGGFQDLAASVSALVSRKVSVPERQLQGRLRWRFARRTFLGAGAGAAAAALIRRGDGKGPAPHLRPPGAAPETAFSALCIRCGNCIRSCPAGIIEPDMHPPSVTALLVPALRFDEDYCRESCNLCGQNCPTGAIAALPLAEKNEQKIGLAQIRTAECLLTIERECDACALVCPRGAIVEEFNKETYTSMVRVDPDRCNGCGACVAVCPPRVITIEAARRG